MNFYARLNAMLADIVKKKLNEDRLLNTRTRAQVLQEYDFTGIAFDLLMGISANNLTDFARQADDALLSLRRQSLKRLDIQENTVIETVSEQQVRSYLIDRNFSSEFTESFDRILTKDIGRPSKDFLVAHFSERTELNELGELSQDMDDWVRLLLIDYFPDRYPQLRDVPNILQPREIRYGSLEIYWELTALAISLGLQNEVVRDFLVNGAYDVFKAFIVSGARLAFGRLRDDEVEFEGDDATTAEEDEQYAARLARLSTRTREKSEEIVERTTKEKFFTLGGQKIASFGMEVVEERTVVRRISS